MAKSQVALPPVRTTNAVEDIKGFDLPRGGYAALGPPDVLLRNINDGVVPECPAAKPTQGICRIGTAGSRYDAASSAGSEMSSRIAGVAEVQERFQLPSLAEYRAEPERFIHRGRCSSQSLRNAVRTYF